MKTWKNKHFLPWLVVLVVALCMATPALATTSSTPLLRMETVGVVRGGETTVVVYLDNAEEICGGNLEIVYDAENFTLQSVVQGDLLTGSLVTINEKYAANTVRISFASGSSLSGDAPLCIITLKANANATLGDAAISFQSVRMYNQDVEVVETQTQDATIEVQYAGLSVTSMEGVSGQAVRVEFVLEGALDVAGGSFEITYDAEQLTAGSVVASTMLSGYMLMSNEATPGTIKVAWVGSQLLAERGTLCTVTFYVEEGTAGEIPIEIENLVFYDENAASIASLASAGSITVLSANEDSPKLWVVGGSVDASTQTAMVGVVLEGRGSIYGGTFTLEYPTEGCTLINVSTTDYTNATAYAVNTDTEGVIQFSWAGASADASAKTLLLLEFSVSETAYDQVLSLGEARLLDSNGDSVGIVDIRSGKLLASEMQLQAPMVDQAEVTVSEEKTELSLVLDVADASLFQQDTATAQALSLMLVLYDQGQMQMMELTEQDYTTTFDENGIAQIAISATYEGTADQAKVFITDASGSFVPLAETTEYTWIA